MCEEVISCIFADLFLLTFWYLKCLGFSDRTMYPTAYRDSFSRRFTFARYCSHQGPNWILVLPSFHPPLKSVHIGHPSLIPATISQIAVLFSGFLTLSVQAPVLMLPLTCQPWNPRHSCWPRVRPPSPCPILAKPPSNQPAAFGHVLLSLFSTLKLEWGFYSACLILTLLTPKPILNSQNKIHSPSCRSEAPADQLCFRLSSPFQDTVLQSFSAMLTYLFH